MCHIPSVLGITKGAELRRPLGCSGVELEHLPASINLMCCDSMSFTVRYRNTIATLRGQGTPKEHLHSTTLFPICQVRAPSWIPPPNTVPKGVHQQMTSKFRTRKLLIRKLCPHPPLIQGLPTLRRSFLQSMTAYRRAETDSAKRSNCVLFIIIQVCSMPSSPGVRISR